MDVLKALDDAEELHSVIPELANYEILESVGEDGTVKSKKNETKITLKMCATHTSTLLTSSFARSSNVARL